jgi:hypothetical protein
VLATSPEDGGPLVMPDNPNAIIRVKTGQRIQGKAHG